MSLCVGITCMCRYFQTSTWHIPAHTCTYLPIVTYLHIVTHTECHYVVGVFLRYPTFLTYLHIPTDRFADVLHVCRGLTAGIFWPAGPPLICTGRWHCNWKQELILVTSYPGEHGLQVPRVAGGQGNLSQQRPLRTEPSGPAQGQRQINRDSQCLPHSRGCGLVWPARQGGDLLPDGGGLSVLWNRVWQETP